MNIKARKHCEMRWIHMATTKEWTGFHADTQWFHIKSQPSRLNNTSQPETPSIFPRSSMKKELEQHFNSSAKSELKFVQKVASSLHIFALSYFFPSNFVFASIFYRSIFYAFGLFLCSKKTYFLYHKFILIPFCIF